MQCLCHVSCYDLRLPNKNKSSVNTLFPPSLSALISPFFLALVVCPIDHMALSGSVDHLDKVFQLCVLRMKWVHLNVPFP